MSFRRVYKKYEYAIQEYVPFEDTMRWFIHTDNLTRKEALWLFDRYTNRNKKKVRIVRRPIAKWEVFKV